MATHMQTERYLKPLFRKLARKVTVIDIKCKLLKLILNNNILKHKHFKTITFLKHILNLFCLIFVCDIFPLGCS